MMAATTSEKSKIIHVVARFASVVSAVLGAGLLAVAINILWGIIQLLSKPPAPEAYGTSLAIALGGAFSIVLLLVSFVLFVFSTRLFFGKYSEAKKNKLG